MGTIFSNLTPSIYVNHITLNEGMGPETDQIKSEKQGFLVAHWSRIHLPMQDTQLQSLIQ